MNTLSQILRSPVGAEIIFTLYLILRLGEGRELIQDYPASERQSQNPSPVGPQQCLSPSPAICNFSAHEPHSFCVSQLGPAIL